MECAEKLEQCIYKQQVQCLYFPYMLIKTNVTWCIPWDLHLLIDYCHNSSDKPFYYLFWFEKVFETETFLVFREKCCNSYNAKHNSVNYLLVTGQGLDGTTVRDRYRNLELFRPICKWCLSFTAAVVYTSTVCLVFLLRQTRGRVTAADCCL